MLDGAKGALWLGGQVAPSAERTSARRGCSGASSVCGSLRLIAAFQSSLMSVIAITGSVSGIGASTRQRLEAAGHQTIGIDLRGADLAADLSSAAGRDAAIAGLLERCGGRLDGLVLCAGLGPQVSDATQIVEVNYYGVVALLDALLPALQRGSSPAAVVVSSVASTQMVWDKNPLGSGLEAGDMQRWHAALAAAADRAGHLAYAGSKNAVIVAVRRRVLAWAQAGVRLNSVAPGAVETPLLQAGMADPGPLQAPQRAPRLRQRMRARARGRLAELDRRPQARGPEPGPGPPDTKAPQGATATTDQPRSPPPGATPPALRPGRHDTAT